MRIRRHGAYESRNFNMSPSNSDSLPINEQGVIDYSKIKMGIKTLEDAVIDYPLKRVNRNFTDKETILRALQSGDATNLKQISKFYYRISGIYGRLCRYLSYMYRYDWYIVPYVAGGDTYPTDGEKGDISARDVNKIIDNFFRTMRYLDGFKAKAVLKDIALKIVVEGCYYGYIIHTPQGPSIQELPSEYCRSRFKNH